MLEQGVDARRPSNDRKRSFSNGDGHDFEAKRRTVDVPVKITSSKSSYGGVHTPSYPVSSLYHSSSHRQAEATSGSYPSHSPPFSGNCMGPVQSTKIDIVERSGFSSYDTGLTEEVYTGYDSHEYPYVQEVGDMGRRSRGMGNPPMSSHSSPHTKRPNRFNLSRYQLDGDEDVIASIPASVEKSNRFKTQRERLLLAARAEQSEGESSSTAPGSDEASLSQGSADSTSQSQSQSQDSFMSQRERLRRFSSEQSRHVVIPNEWDGETRLQEFVAFGNVEAALRPLGLMMARAALVSDSVTTRHRHSASSGPLCCRTSHSNPLAS